MRCAWDKLLTILPQRFKDDVDKFGKNDLQQLHLRLGRPLVMDRASGRKVLEHIPTLDELKYIVNAASRYSPWSSATTDQGYITAAGGHRIGLCGSFSVRDGSVVGLREISALCVRVARDFDHIVPKLQFSGSILIIGPPSSGKTTMLRDLIRHISNTCDGSVAVVDERGELFPVGCGFDTGNNTDVLSFCPKPHGIMMALRTLGAGWIALDEVTAEADICALQQALYCGVDIIATAHGSGLQQIRGRPLYRTLLDSNAFTTILTMQPDKTCCVERMALCK